MPCNFVIFNVSLTVPSEIYFCAIDKLVLAPQPLAFWQTFLLFLMFCCYFTRLMVCEMNCIRYCVVTCTMFPLHRLGFTTLWNSYRISLLFPFKTNNLAQFLYRIAFTTRRFWKWHKIYNGMKTRRSIHGNSWIDWLSVPFWFLHVKTGNTSEAHNLTERLNKSSERFEELYYFFIMSDVEKIRAILVGCCLDNFYGCYLSQQTFNFLIIKEQQKRKKIIHNIISSTISKSPKDKGKRNSPRFWIRPGQTSSC